MSDIGVYATLQAEILTALAPMAITAVPAGVIRTFAKDSRIEELIVKEGIRAPAIGVACTNKTAAGRISAGPNRQMLASLEWEVAVLVDSARSRAEQRASLEAILEEVRDKLHFLPCSLPPTAKYIWNGEKTVLLGDEELLGAIATYQLDLVLCK